MSSDNVQQSLALVRSIAFRNKYKTTFFEYKTTFNYPRYFILLSIVNGGYSNWTLNKPCSVSCGDGVEIWRRFCNNPEPKYVGHNCSGIGNSTELRNCRRKPCPRKPKM